MSITLGARLLNRYLMFNNYGDFYMELYWTLTPSFLVICVSIPSLYILYYIEAPRMRSVYEVCGNQWYWSYRTSAYLRGNAREFDSGLYNGWLTTTASSQREVMWAVCSMDVIHNWGVARCYKNSLGMKMDAYPGRINLAYIDGTVRGRRTGIYLGYCSELCGVHHAYMPISMVW